MIIYNFLISMKTVRQQVFEVSGGLGPFPLAEGCGWSDEYPQQFVVEWLNNGGVVEPARRSGTKTAGYRRITKLIAVFHDAAEVMKGAPNHLVRRLSSTNDEDDEDNGDVTGEEEEHFRKLFEELYGRLERINAVLKFYKLAPACRDPADRLGRWPVRWFPTRIKKRGAPPSPTAICVGEIDVLQQVLRMATEGTLHHLTVCQCGRWYVRRRFDQQFCTPECRTHSATFKAHRRSYMKGYYKEHLASRRHQNAGKEKAHGKKR